MLHMEIKIQTLLQPDSFAIGHKDEWILNLNCTYHIYLNWEFFPNLEELEDGVIYMDNNTFCKIKGIGKVQLKIHDGTIRDLKEFVPDMKKSYLIRVLAGKGLQITKNE